MAYFKLEFGFGRSKSEGKISDSANLADEQVVLEIPGWDFVNGEVERAKQDVLKLPVIILQQLVPLQSSLVVTTGFFLI